jgi:integrase/recombinase XerD
VTNRIYLHYAKCFARHYMRSPAEMGQKEIRDYLMHLLYERKLSHDAYRQAFSSLKFLYSVTLRRPFEIECIPRHRKARRLPAVFSGSEVSVVV